MENHTNYYIPKRSDKDIGFKFRRPRWDANLFFVWNKNLQDYIYMNNSRVSEAVLQASDLMIFTKGEEKMEKRNVNYIGTGYMVVEVSYEIKDSEGPAMQTYFFKTDIKLKAGDLVVVDSTNGMDLCRVQSNSLERSLDANIITAFNKAKAWVVDKVDITSHEKRRLATERKKFIMSQLAERREAMEETAIYNLLAEKDPEAKKLLEELEKL